VNSDTAKAAGLTGSPIAFTDTAFTVTTITIGDDFFNPAGPTISHGSFVKFNWTGAVGHNVTWDSGPTTPANSLTQSSGTFTVRLTGIGTYGYHCTIHGTATTGMHASIDTN
jgi:plastocyanin